MEKYSKAVSDYLNAEDEKGKLVDGISLVARMNAIAFVEFAKQLGYTVEADFKTLIIKVEKDDGGTNG